jgi:hypothetical protein
MSSTVKFSSLWPELEALTKRLEFLRAVIIDRNLTPAATLKAREERLAQRLEGITAEKSDVQALLSKGAAADRDQEDAWARFAELEDAENRVSGELHTLRGRIFFPTAAYRISAPGIYVAIGDYWLSHIQVKCDVECVPGFGETWALGQKPAAGTTPAGVWIKLAPLSLSLHIDELGMRGDGVPSALRSIKELQLNLELDVNIPLSFVPPAQLPGAAATAARADARSSGHSHRLNRLLSYRWQVLSGFRFEVLRLEYKTPRSTLSLPNSVLKWVVNSLVPPRLKAAIVAATPPELGILLSIHSDHHLRFAGSLGVCSLPVHCLDAPLDAAVDTAGTVEAPLTLAGHGHAAPGANAGAGAGRGGALSALPRAAAAKSLQLHRVSAGLATAFKAALREAGAAAAGGADGKGAGRGVAAAAESLPQHHAFQAAVALGLSAAQARTLVAAQQAAATASGSKAQPALRTAHDVMRFVSLHNPGSRLRRLQREAGSDTAESSGSSGSAGGVGDSPSPSTGSATPAGGSFDAVSRAVVAARAHASVRSAEEAEEAALYTRLLGTLQAMVDGHVQTQVAALLDRAAAAGPNLAAQERYSAAAAAMASSSLLSVQQLFEAAEGLNAKPVQATLSVQELVVRGHAESAVGTLKAMSLRLLEEKRDRTAAGGGGSSGAGRGKHCSGSGTAARASKRVMSAFGAAGADGVPVSLTADASADAAPKKRGMFSSLFGGASAAGAQGKPLQAGNRGSVTAVTLAAPGVAHAVGISDASGRERASSAASDAAAPRRDSSADSVAKSLAAASSFASTSAASSSASDGGASVPGTGTVGGNAAGGGPVSLTAQIEQVQDWAAEMRDRVGVMHAYVSRISASLCGWLTGGDRGRLSAAVRQLQVEMEPGVCLPLTMVEGFFPPSAMCTALESADERSDALGWAAAGAEVDGSGTAAADTSSAHAPSRRGSAATAAAAPGERGRGTFSLMLAFPAAAEGGEDESGGLLSAAADALAAADRLDGGVSSAAAGSGASAAGGGSPDARSDGRGSSNTHGSGSAGGGGGSHVASMSLSDFTGPGALAGSAGGASGAAGSAMTQPPKAPPAGAGEPLAAAGAPGTPAAAASHGQPGHGSPAPVSPRGAVRALLSNNTALPEGMAVPPKRSAQEPGDVKPSDCEVLATLKLHRLWAGLRVDEGALLAMVTRRAEAIAAGRVPSGRGLPPLHALELDLRPALFGSSYSAQGMDATTAQRLAAKRKGTGLAAGSSAAGTAGSAEAAERPPAFPYALSIDTPPWTRACLEAAALEAFGDVPVLAKQIAGMLGSVWAAAAAELAGAPAGDGSAAAARGTQSSDGIPLSPLTASSRPSFAEGSAAEGADRRLSSSSASEPWPEADDAGTAVGLTDGGGSGAGAHHAAAAAARRVRERARAVALLGAATAEITGRLKRYLRSEEMRLAVNIAVSVLSVPAPPLIGFEDEEEGALRGGAGGMSHHHPHHGAGHVADAAVAQRILDIAGVSQSPQAHGRAGSVGGMRSVLSLSFTSKHALQPSLIPAPGSAAYLLPPPPPATRAAAETALPAATAATTAGPTHPHAALNATSSGGATGSSTAAASAASAAGEECNPFGAGGSWTAGAPPVPSPRAASATAPAAVMLSAPLAAEAAAPTGSGAATATAAAGSAGTAAHAAAAAAADAAVMPPLVCGPATTGAECGQPLKAGGLQSLMPKASAPVLSAPALRVEVQVSLLQALEDARVIQSAFTAAGEVATASLASSKANA